MSERKVIESRLRKKEAEIQGLEEKLKSARIYVQALKDVLKLVSQDESAVDSDGSPDASLKPGSAVAQARDIILAKGEPVHINEILQAQGKEITRDTKASLTSSLAAYVRRNEIFTRPAPSTYGLIELGHSEERRHPVSPPAGFGGARDAGAASDDDEIPF